MDTFRVEAAPRENQDIIEACLIQLYELGYFESFIKQMRTELVDGMTFIAGGFKSAEYEIYANERTILMNWMTQANITALELFKKHQADKQE